VGEGGAKRYKRKTRRCKLVWGYNTHAKKSAKQRTNEIKRRRKLSQSNPSDVDKSCCPFHCSCGGLRSVWVGDITTLIITSAAILIESCLISDSGVPLTENLSVGLVVFIKAYRTPREFAEEVFWVEFGTRVCHRARPFDGLTA